MKFKPRSDEELDEDRLLPDGIYDAVVLTAEDKVSEGGNEMIELKLDVYRTTGGGTQHVWDFISPHFMHRKFKHFFASGGMLELYESGDVETQPLLGTNVRVQIGRKATGGYPMKNYVVDYLADKSVAAGPRPAAQEDDDLPF